MSVQVNPQEQAYYLWLKARGQRWPLYAPKNLESASDISSENTAPIVCFLGDGYVEAVREGQPLFELVGFSEEERDLITKIAKALGLEEGDFVLKNIKFTKKIMSADDFSRYSETIASEVIEEEARKEFEDFNPRIMIVFGSLAHRALQALGFVSEKMLIFSVSHPRDMIKNPQLKRVVWDTLKPVLDEVRYVKKASN